MSREHEAVDGGFECPECGAERQTPLGIEQHRSMCYRRQEGDQS